MIGLKYWHALLASAMSGTLLPVNFGGQPALNLRGRRPTGSQLRNPADPVQAARIEAAAAKRERRAEKLDRYCRRSAWFNKAHGGCTSVPPRLSILYIAK